jgi:oligopeptidase A
MNPLLDFTDLPRFAEVRPEHVAPAVEQLLAENRTLVACLLADTSAPSWDNFMQPLDDANERLARA